MDEQKIKAIREKLPCIAGKVVEVANVVRDLSGRQVAEVSYDTKSDTVDVMFEFGEFHTERVDSYLRTMHATEDERVIGFRIRDAGILVLNGLLLEITAQATGQGEAGEADSA